MANGLNRHLSGKRTVPEHSIVFKHHSLEGKIPEIAMNLDI